MKIVILDGYTTNPGDLSWDFLNEFGTYTVYDRTPKEKIVERAQGVRYNHNQQDAYRRPDDSCPAGAQVHHSAEHGLQCC